ncbi:MAG: polyprenyl synthetase family protein [Proteobacteria bacterium]|nr:polyprenyl synthetase family protein [Pseudomonadota bacterium]
MSLAQKTIKTAGNPLEELSALLAVDMKAANALILKQMHSDIPLIPQVAAWLIAAGGKRIRPLLTLACARLYGDMSGRPYGLAAAVEFIHTATLLHDDVIDKSEERRGRDSANVVFGNQASVLVGDFLFSRAFQLMVADGSLDVLRILSDASAVISEGEVMQLQTANNIETTMAQYEKVISAKTAALFAAACEIGPVIANADKKAQEAMHTYGHNLGMAFQIADDILDYAADGKKLGKTVGNDFREGKMTAPIIIALSQATPDEKRFWNRTAAEKSQTPDDLPRALDIFQRTDALTRGMDMAHDYARRASSCLAGLPPSALKAILADLAVYAVERDR